MNKNLLLNKKVKFTGDVVAYIEEVLRLAEEHNYSIYEQDRFICTKKLLLRQMNYRPMKNYADLEEVATKLYEAYHKDTHNRDMDLAHRLIRAFHNSLLYVVRSSHGAKVANEIIGMISATIKATLHTKTRIQVSTCAS